MKCSSLQVSSFCTNMQMLLASGIDFEEAVTTLLDQPDQDCHYKKALEKIGQQLRSGNNLTTAIKSTNAFPDYFIDTLELASYSGRYGTKLYNNSLYIISVKMRIQKGDSKRAFVHPNGSSL